MLFCKHTQNLDNVPLNFRKYSMWLHKVDDQTGRNKDVVWRVVDNGVEAGTLSKGSRGGDTAICKSDCGGRSSAATSVDCSRIGNTAKY